MFDFFYFPDNGVEAKSTLWFRLESHYIVCMLQESIMNHCQILRPYL